ncbi:MAG: glycosyltransferase family 39 protein [Elusimicrobia bacterium]|nr:glycosyltransferase family 39 protein [Candidatus Liberimonas magnetica]
MIKNKYLLALAGCICLGYAAHFWFLQHGHVDFITDWSISSVSAFSYVRILSSFDLHIDRFPSFYQPLQTMIASNLLYLTGSYSWLVFILNSSYLILLILSTYLIAKEIGSSLSGYCSVLLVLLYPNIFFAYNMYNLDLPLAAVVTLIMCCLLKSQFFENPYWSFAFSVSLIWGLLIKDPAGAFIIGPVIIAVIIAVARSLTLQNFSIILNLMFSGFIITPVFYRFYLQNKFVTRVSIPGIMSGGAAGPLDTAQLFGCQLTPVFLVLFLTGLAIIYYRRTAFRWQLLLWIIIPHMIVSLMPHWKSVRQVLPSYPAFAVISSFSVVWLIEKIKHQRGRIAFMIIFVMLGILQLFDLTYTKKLLSIKLGGFQYFSVDFNSILKPEKRKENELSILSVFKVIKPLGLHSAGIIYENDRGYSDIYLLISKYMSLNGINCWLHGPEILNDSYENQLHDTSLLLFAFPSLPPVATTANEIRSFDNMVNRYFDKNFSSRINDNEIAAKKKKWESFIKGFEPLHPFKVYGRDLYIYGLRKT